MSVCEDLEPWTLPWTVLGGPVFSRPASCPDNFAHPCHTACHAAPAAPVLHPLLCPRAASFPAMPPCSVSPVGPVGAERRARLSFLPVACPLTRPCQHTPSGGFPAVLDNLWLGEEEAQAVATALQPKLAKTRAAIDGILSDVAILEVGGAGQAL